MMFRRTSLLVVSVLVAVCADVRVQAAASPQSAPGMALDRFLDRQTGRILAADTDGDGRVSRTELDAEASKGGRDPSRVFDAMDANNDGYLDKSEIQAALTRRFQRMDRNHDGLLTPDERMTGRMRREQAKPADISSTQP